MPESLRNHNFGSDRQGVLIDSNSNDEVWAKQQEDQMQDAEKRVVDRAEQNFRQSGNVLAFEDSQGIMAQEQPEHRNSKSKGKDKKEGGGCAIFWESSQITISHLVFKT